MNQKKKITKIKMNYILFIQKYNIYLNKKMTFLIQLKKKKIQLILIISLVEKKQKVKWVIQVQRKLI